MQLSMRRAVVGGRLQWKDKVMVDPKENEEPDDKVWLVTSGQFDPGMGDDPLPEGYDESADGRHIGTALAPDSETACEIIARESGVSRNGLDAVETDDPQMVFDARLKKVELGIQAIFSQLAGIGEILNRIGEKGIGGYDA